MPDPPVAAVQMLREGSLHPLHESAHGCGAWFKKEVNVIGHQAVCVAADSVAEEARPHAGEVFSIVRRIPEEDLPIIAPRDDMIELMRDVDARFARHIGRLLRKA
jgi:hypothetical protein